MAAIDGHAKALIKQSKALEALYFDGNIFMINVDVFLTHWEYFLTSHLMRFPRFRVELSFTCKIGTVLNLCHISSIRNVFLLCK